MNKNKIIGLALFITYISHTGILDDPLKLKEPAKVTAQGMEKSAKLLNQTLHELPEVTYKSIHRAFDAVWERAKDASPYVAAAAVVGATVGLAGYYTYHWAFPTPEKRARKKAHELVQCFKDNVDGPRSSHGIPDDCASNAFAYAVAREQVSERHKWPKTQSFIDDFKLYTSQNP